MQSLLVNISDLNNERWDNGFQFYKYENSQRLTNPNSKLKPLGTLIRDDSYGILTPGSVYSPDNPVTYIRVTDMRPYLGIDYATALKVPEKYYSHKRARLRKNDVLLAVKGASIGSSKSVAFIENEVKTPTLVNGSVFRFQVKEGVDPLYIALLLDSQTVKNQFKTLQILNNAVSYIDKKSIYNLLLPIPSEDEQSYLVNLVRRAYEGRINKLKEGFRYLAEIDDYFWRAIGFSPEKKEDSKSFLIEANKLTRFDFDYVSHFRLGNPYNENFVPIEDIATFESRVVNPTNKPEEYFNYIDIASINITHGKITETKQILGKDAPSRARQLVKTGDILISTVRPTRGAIAIVPAEMDNFVCSTGFSIVRPKAGTTLIYLHTVLRLKSTLVQFGKLSSGSSYPAILEKDIKRIFVPYSSVEMQRNVISSVNEIKLKANKLFVDSQKVITECQQEVEAFIEKFYG